ncbi:hypothetical protein JYT16_02390 [Gemmatimonas aurantiaca]|nr:hypothetical protein [Gemmatimonas aurantiaca]
MRKVMYLLTALMIFAPCDGFAEIQGIESDSLHYRLTTSQAQWSESENSYIATVSFSFRWEALNDTIRTVQLDVQFGENALEFVEVRNTLGVWPGRFYLNDEYMRDGLAHVAVAWDSGYVTSTDLFLTMCELDFRIKDTSGVASLELAFGIKTFNQIGVKGGFFSPLPIAIENTYLWTPSIESVPCCDIPGDSDNSGALDIGDVTHLIQIIFSANGQLTCRTEGDSNGDGSISIADVTYTIQSIFAAGLSPLCIEN